MIAAASVALALAVPLAGCSADKPADTTGNVDTPPTCTNGVCQPGVSDTCTNEGVRRACGEVKSTVGTQVTCLYGTQICAGGHWGACVGSPDGTKTQSTDISGDLHALGLGTPSKCTSPCDPYCTQISDTFDTTTPLGTGGVELTDGGITIGKGLGLPDGATPADLATLSDGGALPPDGGFIFHVMYPGDTAQSPIVFIDAKLRTADMYFLLDVTSSMYDEANAFTAALNDTSSNGIISGIKAALGPLVNFGVGRFSEYQTFPYGFSGENNTPFQHMLSVQPNVTPGQQAAAWNLEDAFPNYGAFRGSNYRGGDVPEATVSALWMASSGRGLYRSGNTTPTFGSTQFWSTQRPFWLGSPITPTANAYPPDLPASAGATVPCPAVANPPANYDPGYPCWRANSTPIYVIVTDAPGHNGPGGWYSYLQIPKNASDDGAGIQGATVFPASTALPASGGPLGNNFVNAVTLPSGATGPTPGIYYGTVPVRASGSGISGGIYSIPPTTANSPALQVQQRSSLRDCQSGGATVCNPISTTVTQDIGLITTAAAPQVHSTLTNPTAVNTATQSSLSNPTALLTPTTSLSGQGPLDQQARYTTPTAPAAAQSAIGTTGTPTAAPYSSLTAGGPLAQVTDALSPTGTVIATGTYSSLDPASYAAALPSQNALTYVSALNTPASQSSLTAPGTTKPADVSQLTSLAPAADPNAPTLALYSPSQVLPVPQAPTITTSAQQSGTVNATLGTSSAPTVGPQSALYNYQPFYSVTQDVYANPAPQPVTVTALGTQTAFNNQTPYDTYSSNTPLLAAVSSLVGTLKTPYNTTPTDTYSAGIPLLSAVSALSGTYTASNSQTPVDTYSNGTSVVTSVTALTRIGNFLPATQTDTYSNPTTPNTTVSSLSTTSSPYNAVQNLTGVNVNTSTQSALTNPTAPTTTGTTSCTLTAPNAGGSTSATYSFGATQNLPGWFTAGSGTQVPGGNAPTAMTQAGSVALAANQAIKVTFNTPQTVQGGKATIYVNLGSAPSTAAYTFAASATQAATTQTFTIYGANAATSIYFGVTRDAGNVLPTVNISYALSTPTCSTGNFVSGGSGAAGTCVSCNSGYTYDSSAQCCSQTTTTTTCPANYTLVGTTCYIIQCPNGWSYNSSTQVCTAPRCATGQTEVSGKCYTQTCPTNYTLASSGTACNPNSNCTSPLVDSGGVCKSQVGCPVAGTGGTTWTFNSSTNTCTPAATCPGKVQWDKVNGNATGSSSQCWTDAGCPTPTANYTRGTGALTPYCIQNQCTSTQLAITGNTLTSDGCYSTTINTTCSGLVATATYSYTGSSGSPAYACVPTNAASGCVSPKVKWDKVNGNSTGASAQCWTDAGCTGTRGTGANTPMCTAPLCNAGYTYAAAPTGAPNGAGCYQTVNTGCSSSVNSNIVANTTYTYNSTTFQCVPSGTTPVGGCPTGKVPLDKSTGATTGAGALCWTDAGCASPGVRGTGSNAELCTFPNCDAGYTYAPSPGLGKTAGCYPTNNTTCSNTVDPSGIQANATYTYAGSPSFTCTPSGTTPVGSCPTGKVKWDKVNGNATGASAQCWTDAGCNSPYTRGTGANTPMCTKSKCDSGYTTVSGNAYATDGCYLTSAINTTCANVTINGYNFSGHVTFSYSSAAYTCTPTGLVASCFEGRVLSTKGGTTTAQCWVDNGCPTGAITYTRSGTQPWICAPNANQCDAASQGTRQPITTGSPASGFGCYEVNSTCTQGTGTGQMQQLGTNSGSYVYTGSPSFVCTPNPNKTCAVNLTYISGTCYSSVSCPSDGSTTGAPYLSGSTYVCAKAACNTITQYVCNTNQCCTNSCPPPTAGNYTEVAWSLSPAAPLGQRTSTSTCVATANCNAGRIPYDIHDGNGNRCWTNTACTAAQGTGGTLASGYVCTPATCDASETLLSEQTAATTGSVTKNGLVSWWRADVNGTSPNYYADAFGLNSGVVVKRSTATNVSIVPGVVGAGFQFANTATNGPPNTNLPPYYTTVNDTGISIADNPSIDITNNLTLAAWIIPYSSTQTSRIIDKSTTSGSTGGTRGNDGYSLELASGKPIVRIGSVVCTSNTAITIGQIRHVTATVASGTVVITVHDQTGTVTDTKTCTGAPATIPVNARPLRIGSDSSATAANIYNGFYGIIDEIAIFNQVVAAADVTKLGAKATTTGLYDLAQCYTVGCPATANEWAWSGTNQNGTPAFVCQATNACSGSRVVSNPDGNGNRCWTDNACPNSNWTKTGFTCSINACNGTMTSNTNVPFNGVSGVTNGCYNINDACTGYSNTVTWSYNSGSFKCDPSNSGCVSSKVRYNLNGNDGCYTNKGCTTPVATGGTAAEGYTCTVTHCPNAGTVESGGVCKTIIGCPTTPPGTTWNLNTTTYKCTPSGDLCGTGRVRATYNSVDQCWTNAACNAGDTGGTAATNYTCTPPSCGAGKVAFGSPLKCYDDLGCPANGSGITWTRNTTTQVCSPSQPCVTGKVAVGSPSQCYTDVGCTAGYTFNSSLGTVGMCQGCPAPRVNSGGYCYDTACPATANGVSWTSSGSPAYTCTPSKSCYDGTVSANGFCNIESCPAGWTLNAATHVCSAPSCSSGQVVVNGTCYTYTPCAPGWTANTTANTCTIASCTPYDGVAPCTSPFSCVGADGAASCQRPPTCAADCAITPDRTCTLPSPSIPSPSLRCATTTVTGCNGTSTSGDGALQADMVFRFTVPTGLPNNRFYYHFGLLRRDSAGHTSDADAFLYIKPASGGDAANSVNFNGRVLDCNRDSNAFSVLGTTDETERWTRSEINSYLPAGDYFLVVDNKKATATTAAYTYVLQVGGFDDNSAPTAVAAPSYNQLITELQRTQAKIIGVESSGTACRQAADGDVFVAQYETRDFLEKLAYDTGSVDSTQNPPAPFVVSIRKDATDCDPTSGSSNGLSQQIVNAATALGDTLKQDVTVRAQLANQAVSPGFQPPVAVSQFIKSVTATSTTTTQTYCGSTNPVVPDTGPDTVANYQKFNLCRPGVQANFIVTFQMPTTIPPQPYDQYFRFDLVILAGVGEVARFPVVLKLPGTVQSAEYVRDYDTSTVCPTATSVRFGKFLWGTNDPKPYSSADPTHVSSNVQFYARFSSTLAGLDTANEVSLDTAKASPLPNTEVGNADLQTLLGVNTAPFLRIRARLNPSHEGDKPIINLWQTTFTCPPAE